MKFVSLVCAVFFIMCVQPQVRAFPCDTNLFSENSLVKFREEIWFSGYNYAKNNSSASPIRGSDFVDFLVSKDAQVISLGSGPDLFSLLFNFPLSSTYHLVDYAQDWGGDSTILFHELINRLKLIAEDTVVETLSESCFTEAALYPCQWKIRWTSPAIGKVNKTIFFHRLNYFRSTEVNRLVIELIAQNKPLAAIYSSWAPLPLGGQFLRLVNLMPKGFIILERFKGRNRVTESRFWRDAILRWRGFKPIKKLGFSLTHTIPDTLRNEGIFEQRDYIFQKQ
jgi:hypothetical protein